MLRLLALAVSPLIVRAVPATRQLVQCNDTNNGTLDKNGHGCPNYAADRKECGTYDDSDFTANDMCCACGGGSEGAALTGVVSAPDNTSTPAPAAVCGSSVYVNFRSQVAGKRGFGGTYNKEAGARTVYTKGRYMLYQCHIANSTAGRWYLGDIGAQAPSGECLGYFRSVGNESDCPGAEKSWQEVRGEAQEWVSSTFSVIDKALSTPISIVEGPGTDEDGVVDLGTDPSGDGSDEDGSVGGGPVAGMTFGGAILLGFGVAYCKGWIDIDARRCVRGGRVDEDLEGGRDGPTPALPPTLLTSKRRMNSSQKGTSKKGGKGGPSGLKEVKEQLDAMVCPEMRAGEVQEHEEPTSVYLSEVEKDEDPEDEDTEPEEDDSEVFAT